LGGKQTLLEDVLRKLFQTVKLVKPPSSRADSAEIYLLAKGFRMWSGKKEVNQNSG
jgi:23S rRNA (uridine2552-2'-O)-methyltransferase